MIEVNEKVATEHGLKRDEYEKICKLLKIILAYANFRSFVYD